MIHPIQKNIKEVIQDNRPRMGLSTGLKDLDNTILGLRPNNLIMIGGGSSMGKSSLCADLVLAIAKEVPVFWASIEMGSFISKERMIYNIADLNYHKGIAGKLEQADKIELIKAAEYIEQLHDIYIDDNATCMYPDFILKNPKEPINNSIELLFEEYYNAGCRALFIDYLQYVQWGFRAESETLRIKEITNKLHRMSIHYSIPVIALCQLKKEVGDRAGYGKDPTPTLSDIRDSGFIINDADIIILLHRPEFFEKRGEVDLFANHVEDAKIIVAKQRNGPVGDMDVKFKSYAMKFTNYDNGRL
jgi:replicative DNA helicase